MIVSTFIATGSCVRWDRLADAGEWAVVLFGVLLWACCLFRLSWLGIRSLSGGHNKRADGKRGK
jgi:hypothetical protein